MILHNDTRIKSYTYEKLHVWKVTRMKNYTYEKLHVLNIEFWLVHCYTRIDSFTELLIRVKIHVTFYTCNLWRILSTSANNSIGIPLLKIRRSHDRLIFNMGIPIPLWGGGGGCAGTRSDLTRMTGYQDNSPNNSHQAIVPLFILFKKLLQPSGADASVNWVISVSGKCKSPLQCQAITCEPKMVFVSWIPRNNMFNEIRTKILISLSVLRICTWKWSSKWWPFYHDLNAHFRKVYDLIIIDLDNHLTMLNQRPDCSE